MSVGICTLCGWSCRAEGGDTWQLLRAHQASVECAPRPGPAPVGGPEYVKQAHGTTAYRRGCRCDECKAACRRAVRDSRLRHIEAEMERAM